MEAKGKVVPGLASRQGHRAYVDSLMIEQRRLLIANSQQFVINVDDEFENENENENGAASENVAVGGGSKAKKKKAKKQMVPP